MILLEVIESAFGTINIVQKRDNGVITYMQGGCCQSEADRNGVSVEQLGVEFRLRPFDREDHLFGLTVVAMPFVGFVNPVTGAPGRGWGGAAFRRCAFRSPSQRCNTYRPAPVITKSSQGWVMS